MEIEGINIFRYELCKITKGDYRQTLYASDDFDIIKKLYEKEIEKSMNKTSHIVLFVFDYDKHTNVEYFDNGTDIY